MPRNISCGLDFCSVPDVKAALTMASENGYTFAVFPIVHPRYKRDFLAPGAVANQRAFTRSDLILGSQDWSNTVVGKASDYIDCDSGDETLRQQSEALLMQELVFATHLGLPAVVLHLHSMRHVNFARIINNRCLHHTTTQFWLCVPMVAPLAVAAQYRSDSNLDKLAEIDTWHWWNSVRLLCNSDKKLGLALEVGADLVSEEEQLRWLGEPLKALVLSTSLFLTNKKGYPVLSQAHQAFLRKAALLEPQLILTGNLRHNSIRHYLQYIEYLCNTSVQFDSIVPYSRGYEDHLQIPLQPLMDNLESNTYEVFEKDPVKYTQYQSALYKALLDRVPPEQAETNVQVVMVVGAGRGPLVNAALSASASANRKVKVYAVEKNPNAIVTLFSLKEEVWGDKVTIVATDMRDWEAPEQCDILVSELLGSFGDNELSPECLDGPERFLKSGGISIPSEYTSWLCPLESSKLYTEARSNVPQDKPFIARFEMPYVVHQLNVFSIAPPQEVFRFQHPVPDNCKDHRRYKKLTFDVAQDCVLHGFSGYFSAVLYKDIGISIVPETYSKGMFSWFPIYFPIKEPLPLLKGSELEVHMWRLADRKSVWYEWCVSKPTPVPIHNPNGRSYCIGLY